MNNKVVASVPAAAAQKDKRPSTRDPQAGAPGTPATTRAGVSRDARLVASGILEVLAGVRTPTEAAKALGFTVPRYYLWEQRALEGLVRACEPRPQGKAASERQRIAALEKEVIRLRQECGRQQALARAAQRTIALAATAKPVAKPAVKSDAKVDAKGGADGKPRRKRRPVARALQAAAAFREPIVGDAADSSSPSSEDVVQRSVHDSSLATAEAAPAAAQSPV